MVLNQARLHKKIFWNFDLFNFLRYINNLGIIYVQVNMYSFKLKDILMFLLVIMVLVVLFVSFDSGELFQQIDTNITEKEILELECNTYGITMICESLIDIDDIELILPKYITLKTPHTIQEIKNDSIGVTFSSTTEQIEIIKIKLNKTNRLEFEIPLMSYGTFEIIIGGKINKINYTSYISPETTYSEEETGKKLNITKTPKGWTQDSKIFTDHALYRDNEIIFSVEVNDLQEIMISFDLSEDSTVEFGNLYVWKNDAWIESDYKLTVESPTYFKQEYNWFDRTKQNEKFNISITGDKGFSALMDPDISACSILNSAGATYTLTADIIDSTSDICIDISANDVTLDCQGHTINAWDGIMGNTAIRVYRGSSTDTNVTIKNCILTDWLSYGVFLRYANKNRIQNVTANSNNRGIYLMDSSSYNNLSNITANSNTATGLYISWNTGYNQITNITMISNSWVGIVFHGSDYNNITNAIIANSETNGIRMLGGNNNIISNTTVSNTGTYGIYVDGLQNTFYNNFFNNTNNIDFNGGALNNWNTTKQLSTNIVGKGYIGGNYWGAPDLSGFSDTCLDITGDDICDSSYTIGILNIDYLPLTLNLSPTVYGWLNVTLSDPIPNVNTYWIQNQTYEVFATVICEGDVGAICGDIEGIIRYNVSSSTPDTEISSLVNTIPFYTIDMSDFWKTETVDSLGVVGRFTSLALDSNYYPHITYYDDTADDLRYIKWNGSDWIGEINQTGPDRVDTENGAGFRTTSIALDSNGYPHIGYAFENSDLRYVKWNGSDWIGEVNQTGPDSIESGGNYDWSVSLALDSNDYPHISYEEGTPLDSLKYVKWNGSAWIGEINQTGPDRLDINIVDNSLVLDSNGYPHIGYGVGNGLRYMKWNGSDWIGEVNQTGPDDVDITINYKRYVSLDLDSNEYPHMSYSGYDAPLKYARWDGVSWQSETVDASSETRQDTSLALDSNDYPHISYHDNIWRDLRYVRWNGSKWLGQINQTGFDEVDTDGYKGMYSSLVLDSNDYPHVSYNDWAGAEDLKYAVWLGENLQSCGILNVGEFCQLNWTVEVTGDMGAVWAIDVNVSSDVFEVESNDTDDAIIVIYGGDLQIMIESPQNQTYNTESVWFNVTLNEPGSGCEYSRDGLPMVAMLDDNSTHFYIQSPVLGEGQHSIFFNCTDLSSVMETSSTEYFTVDTIGPQITIQSPSNSTYITNPWFNVTLDESGLLCSYSLDGALYVGMSSDNDIDFYNLSSVSDGSHSIRFSCTDLASNINTTDLIYFTLDTTGPQITVNSPLNPIYTTQIVLFNITAIDFSGIDWCGYSLNGSVNVTMPVESSDTFYVFNNTVSKASYEVVFYCNNSNGVMNNTDPILFNVLYECMFDTECMVDYSCVSNVCTLLECTDYCTNSTDLVCHSACDGKNGCDFADDDIKTFCDGKSYGQWFDYGGGQVINCCEGAPTTSYDPDVIYAGLNPLTVALGDVADVVVSIRNRNDFEDTFTVSLESASNLKYWSWFATHKNDEARMSMDVSFKPYEQKFISLKVLGATDGCFKGSSSLGVKVNTSFGKSEKEYIEVCMVPSKTSRSSSRNVPELSGVGFVVLVLMSLIVYYKYNSRYNKK